MKRYNALRILRAVILSGFAVIALGFSHLTFSQSTMGMEGMPGHSSSAIQCRIICSSAIKAAEQGALVDLESEAKDPLPVATLLSVTSLSLLAVAFIVKRLYLLSSWRPPDRVLVCGHFADGL